MTTTPHKSAFIDFCLVIYGNEPELNSGCWPAGSWTRIQSELLSRGSWTRVTVEPGLLSGEKFQGEPELHILVLQKQPVSTAPPGRGWEIQPDSYEGETTTTQYLGYNSAVNIIFRIDRTMQIRRLTAQQVLKCIALCSIISIGYLGEDKCLRFFQETKFKCRHKIMLRWLSLLAQHICVVFLPCLQIKLQKRGGLVVTSPPRKRYILGSNRSGIHFKQVDNKFKFFFFLNFWLDIASSEATPWLFAAPFRWIASCHRKTDLFIWLCSFFSMSFITINESIVLCLSDFGDYRLMILIYDLIFFVS